MTLNKNVSQDGFFGIFAGLNQVLPDKINAMDLYEGFYTRIYDFITPQGIYDNQIYREAAGPVKKNILEFASGSGRILLQLAKDGHNITGVDLSGDMIKLCKEKISYMDPEDVKLIQLVQGDMTSVQLNRKFDVIILAICTLCLLYTSEQREAFFKNVNRHLAPGGIFLFDHQIYDFEKAAINDESINFITINSNYPKHFMIIGEKVLYNEKFILVNFFNEIIEQDGTTDRYLGKTKKKMIDVQEIQDLIHKNGMKIIKIEDIPVGEGFFKAIRYYYCRLFD